MHLQFRNLWIKNLLVGMLFSGLAQAREALLVSTFQVPDVQFPHAGLFRQELTGGGLSQLGPHPLRTVSGKGLEVLDETGQASLTLFSGAGNEPLVAHWTPSQQQLVTGSRYGGVKIWSFPAGQLMFNLVDPQIPGPYPRAHEGRVRRLVFSARNPDLLVTESQDRTTKYWQLSTGKLLKIVPGESHLQKHPDGSFYSFRYGQVVQRDPLTLNIQHTYPAASSSFRFSPDGQKLVFQLFLKDRYEVLDLTTRKVRRYGPVQSWAVSPDGKRAAFYRGGSAVSTVQLSSGQIQHTWTGPYLPFLVDQLDTEHTSSLRFSTDGKQLGLHQQSVICCYGVMGDAPPVVEQQQTLVWDQHGRVTFRRAWDQHQGNLVEPDHTPVLGFTGLLNPPSHFLAKPGWIDGEAQDLQRTAQLDVSSGVFLDILAHNRPRNEHTVFTDLQLKKGPGPAKDLLPLTTLKAHPTDLRPVFSPAGGHLALSPENGYDRSPRHLFDTATGKAVTGWPRDLSGPVVAVADSGRKVLVEGSLQAWEVIDARTGRVGCTVPRPGETVLLQFSPDGQHLWVGTRDHLLKHRVC